MIVLSLSEYNKLLSFHCDIFMILSVCDYWCCPVWIDTELSIDLLYFESVLEWFYLCYILLCTTRLSVLAHLLLWQR